MLHLSPARTWYCCTSGALRGSGAQEPDKTALWRSGRGPSRPVPKGLVFVAPRQTTAVILGIAGEKSRYIHACGRGRRLTRLQEPRYGPGPQTCAPCPSELGAMPMLHSDPSPFRFVNFRALWCFLPPCVRSGQCRTRFKFVKPLLMRVICVFRFWTRKRPEIFKPSRWER